MAIPTSGVYTLSVMRLSNATDGVFYNTNNNGYSDSVTVTFNQQTITLGPPFNRTIQYNPDKTSENPIKEGGAGSAVITDTSSQGGVFFITHTKLLPNTTIAQDRNYSSIWYFGNATLSNAGRESNGNRNIFGGPDVCFLKGSQIMTPNGLCNVEELKVGDSIFTYYNNEVVLDTLIWVGKAHCHVKEYLPNDEAGYPVRVKKNAIADGVPFKDLLITSEHCLFFDGKFIPVRMLVNGSSIIYDKNITSFDYYHIETQKHSVIMADGMYTESYLDTGNRNSFQQDGAVVKLYSKTAKNWENDAAAPLCVSRSVAEPLYNEIKDRINDIDIADASFEPQLTTENGLCLITDTQQILYPLHVSRDKVSFVLPKLTKSVQIKSNTSRPCDTIGPFVDDRRKLGVLIGDITLFNNTSSISIKHHLEEKNLDGWCNLENGLPMRWTAGNGHLSLSEEGFKSKTLFVVQIIQSGPYLVEEVNYQVSQKIA